MAPGLKFLSKKNPTDDSSSSSTKRKSSGVPDGQEEVQVKLPDLPQPLLEGLPVGNAKLTLADYIYYALGDDSLKHLVDLSDARDELVKGSSAGFFPDVITGCVDVSMAIVEAMFKFADSIDEAALSDEEVMRQRVKSFMLSILDAVYGPNCVRIAVYNPDVDWTVSLWNMFPVPESPSSRNFLTLVPSQSDTIIQWLDLKSRLIKQCRNPKREAQRVHRIAALEDELQELALRHAALIERFIKIQQGEKDPEAAQAKREALEKRLAARKLRLKHILVDKHTGTDITTRTKRDAVLWGGAPHVTVTASLNNSTVSARAGSAGSTLRRLSRFGFRSDVDPDEDLSDESSAPGDPEEKPEEPKAKVGCLAMFRCCGPGGRKGTKVV